jgi:hypothetical protein
MLDNDDDDEDEEEEPGEIIEDIDERQQKSFQPFNYKKINEDEIFSTSKSRFSSKKKYKIDFLFFSIEKFKRPADDEDIYEPNRRKKSSKVKVEFSLQSNICSSFFSRLQNDLVLNKQTNPYPIHFQKRPKNFIFFFICFVVY